MPISITQGMAGTKRLKNFAINLIKRQNIEIKNICINKKRPKKQEGTYLPDDFQKNLVFNYKNPLNWVTFPSLLILSLYRFKSKGVKNILYNYGYPNLINIFFILYARLIGYKIIFDIVEDNSKIYKHKSLLGTLKNRSSLFLFKKLDILADGIIGISFHIINKLRPIIGDKKKIIHLTISVEIIDQEIYSNNSERHRIFYGGSYGIKDGLGLLLKAFDNIVEKYPQTNLVLTGKGSERDMISFESELEKVKNKNNIINLGYLSDEQYKYQLNSADIYCMTRINSEFANAGFPFKLGEMLATGKPVIATKVGDIEKYLSNKSAVLIEPESVSEIEKSIELLINDKYFSRQIGANGRKVCEVHFNSDILSNRLLNFLNKI
jgi:glycosyltransferase involved in cell wall biosynthesis